MPVAAFLVLELSALGAMAVLELEPGLLLAGVERVADATATVKRKTCWN
jgi:hypothetical protein